MAAGYWDEEKMEWIEDMGSDDKKETTNEEVKTQIAKDVNGNVIEKGTDLIVTENITGTNLKRGDKVKSVRLVADDPTHIEGKVDGVSWFIKTMYVKINLGKKKK